MSWSAENRNEKWPCRIEVLAQFEECKIKWHPRNRVTKYLITDSKCNDVLYINNGYSTTNNYKKLSSAYRRKRAKHFDPILRCEGVWGVLGGEVGQSGRRICWGPAQDMAQLWRIRINCVPSYQKLKQETRQKWPNMGTTFVKSKVYSVNRSVTCLTIQTPTENCVYQLLPWLV